MERALGVLKSRAASTCERSGWGKKACPWIGGLAYRFLFRACSAMILGPAAAPGGSRFGPEGTPIRRRDGRKLVRRGSLARVSIRAATAKPLPITSILALDTAGPAPAVTVISGDGSFDELLPTDRHASERLLAAIESCIGRAGVGLKDLGRIAVCAGPGSFTGVRVGLATAWGLGRALGCPVEAVSTLEALAEASRVPGLSAVAAALDAGRGEVVWQAFDLSGPRAVARGDASRARREDFRAAAGVPIATLPADLLADGGSAAPNGGPLSRALAAAVARAPSSEPASRFSAIYSRPSAAEEKRGP